MTKITLDSFDVITGADGGNSVAVPEIVETGIGATNGFDNLLVRPIDRRFCQMSTQFIGKITIAYDTPASAYRLWGA